jgi:hypothetical protein
MFHFRGTAQHFADLFRRERLDIEQMLHRESGV